MLHLNVKASLSLEFTSNKIIIIKSYLSAVPNPETSVEIMTLRERDIDVCWRCPPSFLPSFCRHVSLSSRPSPPPELKSRLCFTIDIVGKIRHLDNFVFRQGKS